MKHFLYILRSEVKETYYIGVSDDPERRLAYHNGESKGYTRRHRPWKIVYSQPFTTEEQALAAEEKVKSWKSKKMIRLLVEGKVDMRDYL
ncbi:GIY-YIG nuclease family protein [Fodinibius salsisoli]|uniref:GIY-YIG nuclease family protein n=1 Tax=Fodinibius salsisoli TaxID=2820877 RepID=A0ABT3PIK7_9BACT|nr:GIY-YIG nuclease family protein [Fodinibius salsisoli]MCW9705769.1 GIY-YIG nuclease family protein [Fodinibius salsisoli]